MKKILLKILILIIVLILFITLIASNLKQSYLHYYTQTKAICNKTNYCQDYQISCDKERAIMITPISGAAIQQSKNWTDPRTEKQRKLC